MPLLMKTESKNILVVGLGSGMTCGSALLHPIEKLDLVEISRLVIEANKYFTDYNYNALQDKRLRIHIEDAKTYFYRTKEKYDMIISEPSNPWISGIGNLFSVEFYKECARHLKKHGFMVQWVQAYETNEEIIKIILNTFNHVFPEVSIWSTGMNDLLLIGSDKKIKFDFNSAEQRIDQKQIKEDLLRIKIPDLFSLLCLQISSGHSLHEYSITENRLNKDLHPVIEYEAPKALFTKTKPFKFINKLDDRKLPPANIDLFINEYIKISKINNNNFRSLIELLYKSKINEYLCKSLSYKWYKENPNNNAAKKTYSRFNSDSLLSSIRIMKNLIQSDNNNENLKYFTSLQIQKINSLGSFINPQIFSDAIKEVQKCIDLSEKNKATFYYYIGKIYSGIKDYEKSIINFKKSYDLFHSYSYGKETEAVKSKYIQLLYNISFDYFRMGSMPDALAFAEKVLKIDKGNIFIKKLKKKILED